METLTSPSVTNFHHPKPFNPTTTNHRTISPVRRLPATVKPTTKPSFPQKDNFTPLKSNYSLGYPPPAHLKPPPRGSVHRRASSGYAAALIDVAQSNGVVSEVERDARRLLRVLRKTAQARDLMMDEMVVMEFVEKGKFEGHLVELVKIVIGKGMGIGIVTEILEEFQRVIYQLTPAAPPAGN